MDVLVIRSLNDINLIDKKIRTVLNLTEGHRVFKVKLRIENREIVLDDYLIGFKVILLLDFSVVVASSATNVKLNAIL